MKNCIVLLTFFLGVNLFFGQQGIALAKIDKKVGYIDTAGEWLVEPFYKKGGNFSEGLAAVFKDEKWGYIDQSGKVVIDFKYTRVKSFNSGVAIVLIEKRWFYIDKKGNELQLPESDKLYDFEEGGVAKIKRAEQIGLIDTKGAVLLAPKYQKILAFHNGFAKVKLKDKWGMIDVEGKEVVKPNYEDLGYYIDGVTKAKKNGVVGLLVDNVFVPVDGAIKIWDFKKGTLLTYAINSEKKVGFIDRKGKWVIAPTYKKVKAFANGLAPVSSDGKKWGYIDRTGKMMIEEQYRDAEVFSKDGLAPVKISKLWGFIDKKGNLVIPDDYLITTGGFSGLFKKGQEKGFINGMAKVGRQKKWGFITADGKLLKDTWFQSVGNFVYKK